MADILVLQVPGAAPAAQNPDDRGDIAEILRDAGHRVISLPFFGVADAPAVFARSVLLSAVIYDVRNSENLLPIRHFRNLASEVWGEDIAPPSLAILLGRHVAQQDWLAVADDFLLPPIDPVEIAARIRLLLFRRRFVSDADILRYAGTRLDISGSLAFDDSNGKSLPLTPREYELLRFLMTHRGKFFARERLLDMVWGVDFTGGERTVDIHIRRLRSKLPVQTGLLLETRRTLGYGFASSHDRPR